MARITTVAFSLALCFALTAGRYVSVVQTDQAGSGTDAQSVVIVNDAIQRVEDTDFASIPDEPMIRVTVWTTSSISPRQAWETFSSAVTDPLGWLSNHLDELNLPIKPMPRPSYADLDQMVRQVSSARMKQAMLDYSTFQKDSASTFSSGREQGTVDSMGRSQIRLMPLVLDNSDANAMLGGDDVDAEGMHRASLASLSEFPLRRDDDNDDDDNDDVFTTREEHDSDLERKHSGRIHAQEGHGKEEHDDDDDMHEHVHIHAGVFLRGYGDDIISSASAAASTGSYQRAVVSEAGLKHLSSMLHTLSEMLLPDHTSSALASSASATTDLPDFADASFPRDEFRADEEQVVQESEVTGSGRAWASILSDLSDDHMSSFGNPGTVSRSAAGSVMEPENKLTTEPFPHAASVEEPSMAWGKPESLAGNAAAGFSSSGGASGPFVYESKQPENRLQVDNAEAASNAYAHARPAYHYESTASEEEEEDDDGLDLDWGLVMFVLLSALCLLMWVVVVKQYVSLRALFNEPRGRLDSDEELYYIAPLLAKVHTVEVAANHVEPGATGIDTQPALLKALH